MDFKQFKQLKKHLFIYNGATLQKNGAHAIINGGFFVAVKTLLNKPLSALKLRDVNKALKEAKRDGVADFVGFEVVAGRVSIEYTIHTSNTATALYYAKQYQQKRIYDICAGYSLNTGFNEAQAPQRLF